MYASGAGACPSPPALILLLLTLSHIFPHFPHFTCSEELQKAAVDADAVRHLAHLLAQQQQQQQPSTATPRPSRAPTPSASLPNDAPGAAAGSGGPSEGAAKAAVAAGSGGSRAGEGAGASGGGSAALQEGVLRALGNMCLTWNDGRKQLIEAKVRGGLVGGAQVLTGGLLSMRRRPQAVGRGQGEGRRVWLGSGADGCFPPQAALPLF